MARAATGSRRVCRHSRSRRPSGLCGLTGPCYPLRPYYIIGRKNPQPFFCTIYTLISCFMNFNVNSVKFCVNFLSGPEVIKITDRIYYCDAGQPLQWLINLPSTSFPDVSAIDSHCTKGLSFLHRYWWFLINERRWCLDETNDKKLALPKLFY